MNNHPVFQLHYYVVKPGQLLAGEHPGSSNEFYTMENIKFLVNEGVSVFIDLTENFESYEYSQLAQQNGYENLLFYHFTIGDRQVPPIEHMKEILNTIDTAINQKRTVYVHCLAGIGRTGTVIGCYLARNGLNGESALLELNRLRKNSADGDISSPETRQQRQFVLDWQE